MRGALVGAWLLLGACTTGPGVTIATDGARILVAADNEPFAEYRADGPRGPCVWPLHAPGGQPVTRAFPFAEVAGEAKDHPHHTSLWFAHGAVNGVDYWSGDGRITAYGTPVLSTHTIAQACEWRDGDGVLVATEGRTFGFHAGASWRAVDVAVVLAGATGPLHFGDTKEGTMAVRLRGEFCLPAKGGAGRITNSEGGVDAAAWGKRARWVAYSAVLDGVPHTVALFDHPQNLRHPTTWHARDYGLCAANPFGLHDFTKAPPGTGDLEVPYGSTLQFRYRVWVHRGACDAAAIDAAWHAFVGG